MRKLSLAEGGHQKLIQAAKFSENSTKPMKSIKRTILTAAILLSASTTQTFAIEGLQISLVCSNVVLSWPSDPSETYMVQYRQTLNATDTWQTVALDLPADPTTNVTFFVHTNVVQNPSCGCGGSSFAAMNASRTLAMSATEPIAPVPMAIPADGSGGAVPLALYPPGFDLTGFLIVDPISGETVDGAGYSVQAWSPLRAMDDDSGGGLSPTPLGGPVPDGDSGGTAQEPETGFYQVARIGVHIIGLDNFTNLISNTISIPFEAANEVGSLHDVIVLVDGARYRGAEPLVAPGVHGTINLDTSFLENGNHTVQVVGSWLNPDVTDPNNHFFTRYSDPFTLSVSNIICYPNWEDEIGELGFAYYSFETTCTNSTWQIDIYDVSNRLARTLSGNTGDGFVETNWDLIDLNGVTRATNDDDTAFSSIITVGDPTTKATPGQKKTIVYPSHGQWAIAYQDMFGNLANSNIEFQAISMFGSMAAQFGGAYSVFPTLGHPEYGQTFPMRYPYTNDPAPPTPLQIIADEKALVGLLTNNAIRNFYYGGHSGPTDIATVDALRISIALKNHYYRFVFVNGCSSANGSLPPAFGINLNSSQPASYFQTHGTRPRTFLGYDQDVLFSEYGYFIDPETEANRPGRIPSRITDFLNNFEFYWNFNYDVSTAIYDAENDTPDLLYGWADGPNLNLIGYPWLHIDEYNYQSDWSN